MKQVNYLKSLLCLTATVALVGCSATRYDRSTGQQIDDGATSRRVNAAIAKDSIVKGSEITVNTFRGNVHLTGFVDHPVQRERASQITRNVKGVQYFKNDILIKDEMPLAQQMFQEQQIDEPAGANRQRQNFSGSSRTSADRSGGWQKGSLHAYDPAAEVSTRTSSTINGRAQSQNAGAVETEAAGSNSGLSQRITTQLQSDNSTAAQNVRVETSGNGKVTLRGTVSSEQEKRSMENRVKGIQGVSSVDNELEVQD